MLTFLTTAAFAAVPLAALDLTGGDNGLSVIGGLQISFGLNPLRRQRLLLVRPGRRRAVLALSWYVLMSQTGKAIQAIGRNPVRAAAMGYSVPRYRVALTIYASLIASLGGWLYALQTQLRVHRSARPGQLDQRARLRADRRRRHDPGPAARRGRPARADRPAEPRRHPVVPVHRHHADAGRVPHSGRHARFVASLRQATPSRTTRRRDSSSRGA